MPPPVRALVFSTAPGDRYRVGRTLRALKGLGLVPDELDPARPALGEGPVWLVGAGAWPRAARPTLPPPSATRRPLCALGNAQGNDAWAALQADSGGDLSRLSDLGDRLPPIVSAYLDAEAVADLARRLSDGSCLSDALRAEIQTGKHRVIRFPPLDVHTDDALRVVQVVTSLQRGGAERVAIDLHRHLSSRGVRSLLIVLGRPTRAPFPTPPGTLDVSAVSGREARIDAAHRAALDFGADLIHAHLLRGEELARLSSQGIPVAATVHNTRRGWPPGFDGLRPGGAALLLACSQAVEADALAARLPVPVRTAWNGVDFSPFERTPALRARAEAVRRLLGLAPDDFVLLALANPRPQKRLDRLPAIVAATRARLPRRNVRLVIAGEASATDEAEQCVASLRAEVARLGLRDAVRLIGAADDVPALLAAADALVSTSRHEGLSLAHLEALAAGLPLVATDAGGTAELARGNPAVTLLPLEADAGDFAEVLARQAVAPGPSGRDAAAVHFTTARMVERHAWLYPRAVEAPRGPRRGDGLVLVINNFSTGGAQSSARRLLLALAAEGVRVRAAVLQERPDYPTPGRTALRAAGVEVFAAPPPEEAEPAVSATAILEWLDADPPAAVLFWNALTQHKLLLADGLFDVPVFDVSPGEMYFESLERYFARPRPGLPYRNGADYGARLTGVIVKYRGEAELAARILGAPVHVIANGVPLWKDEGGRMKDEKRQADCGSSFILPPSSFLRIGTAVRISPRKRLEDLLAAVRLAHPHLPPYVLRIAGGVERDCDDYAAKLRRLADGLPVEWVGERDDVRPFLARLDLFAMISEPAGCPNASLEAMAAGLPVIATDFGGAGEQVVDGVTGRLVPPRDAPALAAALIELADAPQRRREYGTAGRARAEALFDLRRMAADYRRVCLGGVGCI
jgi:glycosyltransferase involved in cell wall biosynthesis